MIVWSVFVYNCIDYDNISCIFQFNVNMNFLIGNIALSIVNDAQEFILTILYIKSLNYHLNAFGGTIKLNCFVVYLCVFYCVYVCVHV